MTGGAVAGGYFTWQYRSSSKTANAALKKFANADKDLKTCSDALGAATLKATELEKQNTEGSKNLNA